VSRAGEWRGAVPPQILLGRESWGEREYIWDGGLSPSIETDVSAKALFGRGSGESIQFGFEGDGWVLVQPFEEAPFQQNSGQSQ